MKYQVLLIILLIYFSGNSQEIIGYAINEDDEKIEFYQNIEQKTDLAYDHWIEGDLSILGQFVYYLDKNNDFQKLNQKKIKELHYASKKYISLPIKGKTKRIQEVIADNNKYLLTQYYFHGVNYFYVFQKDNMEAVERKIKHSKKKKEDLKNYENYIVPYFSDCPKLLKRIKYNIENIEYNGENDYQVDLGYANNYMFNTITGFICEQ